MGCSINYNCITSNGSIKVWIPFDILAPKPSEEKESTVTSNLSASISKGKDQGKLLENVSTKFYVGTEVSRFVHCVILPART